MKNYLMFALLIGATASMAFGQFGVVVDPAKVDVACPDDECHVAPVFMGEGGFVGELADGFDMANFVVTCGNTTASGSAAGDGGGVVRQLFSMANGLACHAEGGSIQIHGLADGGWYWINDDMNSAVSPLIAKDALMGDEVMPTDPGGVTLTAGDYGTYVKSGDRVGILPHFVPTAPVEIPEIPEPEAATICMPEWDPAERNRLGAYVANKTDCMLGDGGTKIVMTAMTSDGRSSHEVTSVHRNPSGGTDVQVALDLWGNDSGHIAGGTNPHLGWGSLSVPSWYNPKPAPFTATFSASLSAEDTLGTGLSAAGVTLNPGKEMNFPTGKVKAARAEGDDDETPEREDGFYMDSTTGENAGKPQCTQNVRTFTDSAQNTTRYLQFVAASGSDPVEIDAAASDDAPGNGIDWTALEAWIDGYNADSANTAIKTVRVVDPDDDTKVYDLPAVVCEQEMAPRYVGATLSISPTTTYCNRDNNRTAVVYVGAWLAADNNGTVTPPIRQNTTRPVGLNASTALQVHCSAE